MLRALRTGVFLTPERLTLWACALLIAYTLALGVLGATRHGLNDFYGRPLGSDFSDIYAAGRAALHGDPESPFQPAEQYRREQTLFGHDTPFYGWHYPPFFLLIAAPLAALPYLPALLLWQLATMALYLVAIRSLLRKHSTQDFAAGKGWQLAALAFPAVFINLTHGQNGFLTTSLVAGGIACLERRPVLSGILFALLIYKPQFGLMIPVALVAEARWKTLAAAAVGGIALAGLTTAIFGIGVWQAFVSSLTFTRTAALEDGAAGFFKLQSIFAWARMWHAPLPLAYFAQCITASAAAVLLFRLWRSDTSRSDKGAALCVASLLATPYCYDYDMLALAPAIALLASNGCRIGFRNYEKVTLALLWISPFFARAIAQWASIPLGVLAMSTVFLMLTWYWRCSGRLEPSIGPSDQYGMLPVAASEKPL